MTGSGTKLWEITKMNRKAFSFFLVTAFLSIGRSAIAQGGASHFAPDSLDSIEYGSLGDWLTQHVGGDLFLDGEICGLHSSDWFPLRDAGGIGAEIRIHPIFVGVIGGFTGGGGNQYSNTFVYSSLYIGAMVGGYRVEVGKTYADSSPMEDKTPSDYRVYFLGVSKRFGTIAFVEPDIRVMFPTVGHLWQSSLEYEYMPVTEYYHLNGLFFALSVKVGVGIN